MPPTSSLIQVQQREHVTVLTLNRTQRLNAIDDSLAAELAGALDSVAEDDAVWVVVLTAAGPHFSVGRDLWQAADPGNELMHERAARRSVSDPWRAARSLRKPLVALLRGYVLGAGLELALACDFRLLGSSARLGFPEVQHGLIPSRGGTQLLPRIVGRSHAADLILTGRQIDAAEAVDIGLALHAVPDDQLEQAGDELVQRLLGAAPLALRYAKEAIVDGADLPTEAGVTLELDLSLILQTSHDRSEGIAAFLEKRSPTFTGD